MCLSLSVLRFNILCGPGCVYCQTAIMRQSRKTLPAVCVCVLCLYLCEPAFIRCIFDIKPAAWEICFTDCICERAIKSERQPSRSVRAGVNHGLNDRRGVCLWRLGLVRFNVNWWDSLCDTKHTQQNTAKHKANTAERGGPIQHGW